MKRRPNGDNPGMQGCAVHLIIGTKPREAADSLSRAAQPARWGWPGTVRQPDTVLAVVDTHTRQNSSEIAPFYAAEVSRWRSQIALRYSRRTLPVISLVPPGRKGNWQEVEGLCDLPFRQILPRAMGEVDSPSRAAHCGFG